MSGDRINDVYDGDLYGRNVQEELRDRVHWMCSRAKGSRVLDVGCSQGITGILLAREGFRVLGIDVDGEAIERARADLAREPDGVRQRLELRCGSVFDEQLEDGSFDTVLLGEVVEHVAHPERLLDLTARLLAPAGVIVITTPFGILDDPDHKQTFYLSTFSELIARQFAVGSIEVRHKRIRFVGSHKSAQGEPPIRDALRISEDAFRVSERAYLDEIRETHEAYDAARKQRDRALAERDSLRKELQESAERRSGLERNLDDLERERQRLEQELAAERQAAEQQRRVVSDHEQALRSMSATLTERDEHLRAARAESEGRDEQLRAARMENEELGVSLEQSQQMVARKERYIQHRRRQLEEAYDEIRKLRLDAEGHLESVRYQLGDSVLRAAIPSRETLLLPRSLVRLVHTGLKHRRQRGEPVFVDRLPLVGEMLAARLFQRKQASPDASTRTPEPTRHRRTDPDVRVATPTVRAAVDLQNWRVFECPQDVRVLSVLDEFSAACFRPETTLVEPRPDNWRPVAEFENPDVAFVESAWKGNSGSWQYRVARYANPPGRELPEMVSWLRDQGVPTVFWNKEDPVHFHQFIDAARLFEFVLTTDAEKIPAYRAALGHDQVMAMPFAAQPRLHRPSANGERRLARACFAGSYYVSRFDDRRREMESLLDAARPFGLDIYDRNHGMTGPAGQDFQFPERFRPHIKGRLQYDKLIEAHHRYRLFLNVNSVVDSPTMFSRRIFELLACGTPVVSTYSRGIEELLGDDVVWMVRNEKQAAEAIEALLRDDREWRRRRLAGVRRIMSEHTYRRRFASVLSSVGFGHLAAENRKALLIAEAHDALAFARLRDSFVRQTYPHRELLVFSPPELASNAAATVGVRLESLDSDRNEILDEALKSCGASWIGRLEPATAYGRDFLADLMAAVEYADADAVGKAPDVEHEYVYGSVLLPQASLVRVTSLARSGLRPIDVHAGDCSKRMAQRGLRLFAADSAQCRVDVANWCDDDAMATAVAASEE